MTFFLPDLMWVESDFPGSKRSMLVIQNHVEEERIVLQSHHFSGVFNSQTSTSGGYYPFMFQPRKSRNLFGLWRRDGFLKSLSHLKRPGYIYIYNMKFPHKKKQGDTNPASFTTWWFLSHAFEKCAIIKTGCEKIPFQIPFQIPQ